MAVLERRRLHEAGDDCRWVTINGNHVCIGGNGHSPNRARNSGEAGGATSTSRTVMPAGSRDQPLPSQTSAYQNSPSETTRASAPSTRDGTTTIVGSIDPTSQRMVLQPTNDLDVLKAEAHAAVGPLTNTLKSIVSELPGTRFIGVRAKMTNEKGEDYPKGIERVREKMAQKSAPASTLSDYIGGRIAFDSDSGDVLFRAIGRRYQILLDDKFFDKPKEGYRARHLQILLPNGMTAEVQLVPREIALVQEQAHKPYDVLRSSSVSSAEREAATAESRKILDGAWSQWIARTSTIREYIEAVLDWMHALRRKKTTVRTPIARTRLKLVEDNPYHEPAGSPIGGQFAHAPGGDAGGSGKSLIDPKDPDYALGAKAGSHRDLVNKLTDDLGSSVLTDKDDSAYLGNFKDNWDQSSSTVSGALMRASAAEMWGGTVYNDGAVLDANQIFGEFAGGRTRYGVEQVAQVRQDLQRFMKAQYGLTQEKLADYPETLTLYRGASGDEFSGTEGEELDVELGALSSFSELKSTADSFPSIGEGYTIKIEVPKEAIFSYWNSGPGVTGEREFIVIGDKRRFEGEIVREPENPDDEEESDDESDTDESDTVPASDYYEKLKEAREAQGKKPRRVVKLDAGRKNDDWIHILAKRRRGKKP